MRSVAPQSLSKNFTQMSFTCKVLKIFYISILEACGSDDSSQKDCQKCLSLALLARQKSLYVQCIQAPVQFWNKVAPMETLCVSSASELFLMALQKGYFHSCSHSTLFLPFLSPQNGWYINKMPTQLQAKGRLLELMIAQQPF